MWIDSLEVQVIFFNGFEAIQSHIIVRLTERLLLLLVLQIKYSQLEGFICLFYGQRQRSWGEMGNQIQTRLQPVEVCALHARASVQQSLFGVKIIWFVFFFPMETKTKERDEIKFMFEIKKYLIKSIKLSYIVIFLLPPLHYGQKVMIRLSHW